MPDTDEFLEHYGVKGMKWGKHMAKPTSEKAVAKADQKWEKSADSRKNRKAVQKATVDRMNNREIRRINDKPEYSKRNLKRNPMLKKQYLDEVSSTFERVMAEESARVVGTSPSGKTSFTLREDPVRGLVGSFTEVRQSRHAEDDVEFLFTTDDLGHIVSVREVEAVAHEDRVTTFLEHYGVKGMKWGVRNDRGHEGEVVKTKKLGKLDKQWEKEHTGVSMFIKLHNAAADKMNNGGIDEINNRPEFKKAAEDGIFNDINHPITQKYYKAHDEAMHQAMVEEGGKFGMNPSGTKRFEVREVESPDGKYKDLFLVDVDRKLKHAEEDEEEPQRAYRLQRDRRGRIVEYIAVDGPLFVEASEAKHADEVGDFLEHYGVKGMKWGVSRRTKDTSPEPATSGQKNPGGRVTATGGKRIPASEDALTAARLKQTARKSRTDALSNAELQTAIRRMQLEQDFARLSAPTQNKGVKFVKGILGDIGKEKAADRLDFLSEEDPKLTAVANAFRKQTNTPRPKKKN